MSTNKGSPKYTVEYITGKKIAVHCSTQEEWDKVYPIMDGEIDRGRLNSAHYSSYVAKEGIAVIREHSKKYGTTICDVQHWRDKGYEIVSASLFLEHNTIQGEQWQPQIGDWVVLTKDQNGDPVGTIVQVANKTSFSINYLSRKKKVGETFGASIKYLRPATSEEIAKVQGKVEPSQEWQVGDIYVHEDNAGDRSKAWYIRQKTTGTYYMEEIEGDGMRKFTYTKEEIDKYIKTKQWLPLKELLKAPKNGKEWICTSQDGVEMYDGDMGYWISLQRGKWEWTCIVSVCKANVKGGGALTTGQWKVFSTELAARKWLSEQELKQVPVTEENAYGWCIGDRVERINQHDSSQVKIGEFGTVIAIDPESEEQPINVRWDKGNTTWSVVKNTRKISNNKSNQITNQKQKPTEYEKANSINITDLRTNPIISQGQCSTGSQITAAVYKTQPKVSQGSY